MKTVKRALCLLLCLCTVLSLVTVPASAASYINKITVTVATPYVGDKPANAKIASTASTEVIDTEWEGELDADGRFKAGVKYTVTVTVGIKEEYDEKYFKKSTNPQNYTINGNRATVVSHDYTEVVLRYTFKEAQATKTIKSTGYKVTAPKAGAKPASMTDSDRLTRKVEWLGTLNADGTFKVGEQYTMRMTLTVKDPSATVLSFESGEDLTINGYPSELISSDATSVTVRFRFAPVAEKKDAVIDENGALKVADFYYIPAQAGEKPSYDVSVSQSDVLEITNVEWSGTFDENGCFIAKKSYTIKFTVKVKDGVNATILGKGSTADVREYRINGKLKTANLVTDGKTFTGTQSVTVTLPDKVVDMAEIFTLEQADAVENTQNAFDLIINADYIEKFLDENYIEYDQQWILSSNIAVERILLTDPTVGYATRMLVDCAELDSSSGGDSLDLLPNMTEVWLAPGMDVSAWIIGMQGHTPFGYEGKGRGPNTWDFVLYVSGDENTKNMFETYLPAFRIRYYTGDVYKAFAQGGEKAGHDWCTNHTYDLTLRTPDRIYKYSTCHNTDWYWYSCRTCGKPSYSEKKIFAMDEYGAKMTDVQGIGHNMTKVIDEKYFVGYNGDGDPVYAESCIWCGASEKDVDLVLDLTEAEYNFHYHGNELDMKTYRELTKASWEKYQLPRILQSTVEDPAIGYFVVEKENVVTATVRASYSNNVRMAAQEGLVDLQLMGNDYNKQITRLQFCSVAVRLAEKMAGVEITPAPANTFTDTSNVYALKAYAAGITTGQTATTFNPNGTLTRQQMATFLYRALMWVRDNSDVRYTPYESKISTFTDANLLRSYAKEPMAFMNALGLINGNTATTLNPDGKCTIQQAITVAYRSLDADGIGWYQCVKWDWDGDAYFIKPENMMFTMVSHAVGDRVWVSGTVETVGTWLKVESPDTDRTNTPMYLPRGDFKPIKELKADDAERYYQYAPET